MSDQKQIIEELRDLLNEAAAQCANAQEDTLSFVHGRFVGVSDGIRAMGYSIELNQEYFRFTVRKDPDKNEDVPVYAAYLTKMIESHRRMITDPEEAAHEHAIIDGMTEVLWTCGWHLIQTEYGMEAVRGTRFEA